MTLRILHLVIGVFLGLTAFSKCGEPTFWLKVMRNGEVVEQTSFHWQGDISVYSTVYVVHIRPGDLVLAHYNFSNGANCDGPIRWYRILDEGQELIQGGNAHSSEIWLSNAGEFYVFGQGDVHMGFSFRVLRERLPIGLAMSTDPRTSASPPELFVAQHDGTVLLGNIVTTTLILETTSSVPSTLEWSIFSISGALLASGLIMVPTGLSSWVVPIDDLPRGMHLFTSSGNVKRPLRFMKE